MIRAARFTDIPALTDLVHEAAKGTRYAANCTFDEQAAKTVLSALIGQKGKREEHGTFCVVVETDGEIRGLLFMVLQRVYFVAHQLRAMDVFFYTRNTARPGAGLAMLAAAEAWCRTVPGLVEMAVTPNDTLGDYARFGRILARRDWQQFGAMYRRNLT
jgi:hypothetical protein